MNYIQRVHKVVRRIPAGKVATYGQIAKIVGVDPRMVGWALHQNKDPGCPCHRVVDRTGRLAPGFAFGGAREQRMRLSAEGLTFKDEIHVDLKEYLCEL